MAASSERQERRIYKLAVYGVRSSGKTCILSALTLPRIKHPLGYSCSWIESVPDNPLPAAAQELEDSPDPLHVGWRFLTQQRAKLRSGDVPEPNKIREEVMAFRFEFSTRDRGARQVELIDYAGELVTASASDIAARLRKHMNACDGLLILAETPYPDRDQAPLADELKNLENAFSLLRNEKAVGPRDEWPVAILFNKWDRRGGPLPTAESATRLVEEFLNRVPPPPHGSLVDSVVNAVGEDNVRCFPVSAFGGHRMREDGKEVPLLLEGVMQSYCLEDGFLWAIQRSEELEIDRLAAAEQGTSWWAAWQLFGVHPGVHRPASTLWQGFLGTSALKGIAAGLQASTRLADGDSLKRRSRLITGRFALKTASQVLAALALLPLGEWVVDGVQTRQVSAVMQDANASDDELATRAQWLEDYYTAPSYRHLLSRLLTLGRNRALALRDEITAIRESRDWKQVEDITESVAKVAPAEMYLKKWPGGPHQAEANVIVLTERVKQHERANLEELSTIDTSVGEIGGAASSDLQALDTLLTRVGRLPYPDAVTSAVTARQEALREAIQRKQTAAREIAKGLEWNGFVTEFREAMQDGRVLDAASMISRPVPGDPRLAELVADFKARAPEVIRTSVKEAMGDYAWDEARKRADVARAPAVTGFLEADDIADLQRLGDTVAEGEDEHLYAMVIRNRPACRDQIKDYLDGAPIQSMRREVEEYRQYLTNIDSPLDLTLVLSSIRWGSKFYGNVYSYRNDISVKCRGEEVIARTGVASKSDSESRDIGEGSIRARLRETVTLEVFIRTNYGSLWDSQMNGGHGEWQGTPEELRKGVSVDAKGDGFVNHATFSVRGIPNEPKLPPWRR